MRMMASSRLRSNPLFSDIVSVTERREERNDLYPQALDFHKVASTEPRLSLLRTTSKDFIDRIENANILMLRSHSYACQFLENLIFCYKRPKFCPILSCVVRIIALKCCEFLTFSEQTSWRAAGRFWLRGVGIA